jgi:hypothetical protein
MDTHSRAKGIKLLSGMRNLHIDKEILNLGNAYYHSVQNLFSSSHLQYIILPVIVYGCGTWRLVLREEH